MSELDASAPDQVRLTYSVDFIHPASGSRIWSNALREESEDKAWASVKQLRCWYYAHRVSVLRYDPTGKSRTGLLQAAEWDRAGNQTAWMTEAWEESPDWMSRRVLPEDRVPPPTRGVT